MARQNLYFFVVSAFDAPPATLTRSVVNVNDTPKAQTCSVDCAVVSRVSQRVT